MIPYPSLDPDIIRIGPLHVRWYGMMYILGFISSYILVRHQIKKKKLPVSAEFLDSFYAWLVFGLIIGARLGYALIYNWSYYSVHPLEILAVWEGGMSFHGGLIGSVAAGLWCCKRYRVDAWQMADMVTITAPIGLGLGRIGNFINGELYGRVTAAPWGMVFPGAGPLPRHPSQLYEFLLEGVVLFTFMWNLKDRSAKTGAPAALFVVLYGIFRFVAEFFREPDPQLGFVAGPFTMGQVLSLLMALGGGVLLFYRSSRQQDKAG
jgi:phosphatidylglycerol:prolipoprotein diacylglycerol transferase